MIELTSGIIITREEARDLVKLIDMLWEDGGKQEYLTGTFNVVHNLKILLKKK